MNAPARLTTDELNELARDVAMNRVYCANTEEGIRWSFGFLLGMLDPPMTKEYADQVGAIYESLDKALPRGVNGYPMFTSLRFLHADDLPELIRLVEEKRRVLETL